MHGENLLVNDGGNWEAIEAIGEGLPQFDVVPSLAFIVEAIDTIDGGALVVATENEEILGIFDLVCQEKADGLEGLLAAVHVVAKEEVVCFRREASVLEQAEKIVILAMNVTADLERVSSWPNMYRVRWGVP